MTRSLLHRAWRTIPHAWRLRLFLDVAPIVAPRPASNPKGGMPVGIAGWFGSASGLGEGARLGYSALDDAGLAPQACDLSRAFAQNDLPSTIETRPLIPGGGGSLIVHINAPYLPYAMCALGRRQVAGRRIVAYWAWELPRLSEAWRPGFKFVHEIWVPSRFTQSAIAAATGLPVHVLPHPLPEIPTPSARRQDFGLPDDALLVLNSFHLGSNFARKNPIAAITAFRRAFGDRSDRILVIKMTDPGNVSWARQELDAAIAGAANIRIIDRTLSSDQMTGLMALCDIVISTHRSEGFGLICAEGMRLGKPVIATGWSGNLDFMNDENSALLPYKMIAVEDRDNAFSERDQKWADPDVDAAVQWLVRLADDAELRRRMGAKAACDVAGILSPARYARTVEALLRGSERP
jgi:glycosyltransferase involved in cell wall biosynthesis